MSRPLHPNEYIKEFSYDSFNGMKITFINMPLREAALPNVPPEGPGILAAIARRYGAEPYIIDLNGYRIKDELAEKRGLPNGRHMTYAEAEAMIVQHLNNVGDQDVIAFSGKITTLRWQEEVAKIVKKHQPDCFLVTGNGLATEIKTGLFKWIPELDAIGRSEGDDIILLILNDAMAIKKYGYENALNSDIKVPVWGLGANNSSATPFTMKRSLTTVSSRGCPYACAFCYRGSQGERNYGMRAVEDIATQVRGYVDNYNLDFIGFPDDNFAVSKKRIAKFPEVFKEYGLENMRWGTHTRMDEADSRIFDMAKSGCVYIGFGAESASEHTLTVMKKGGFILRNGMVTKNVNGKNYEFPKTMVDAIVNCKDANIHPNCTWIMAYPGEDLHHLQTSVAFILWQREFWTEGLTPGTPAYDNAHAAVNSKMFTATAYPGTDMWKVVKPQLQKHFDISFDFLGNPVCDDNFHRYVLELDDATKVLNDKDGNPVNFGEMPMDTFLQTREYIDGDEIEKVLEL